MQCSGSEDARAFVLGHVRGGGALGDRATALLGRVLEDLDAALRRIRVFDGFVFFAARGFVVVVAAVGLGVRVGGRGAEVSA